MTEQLTLAVGRTCSKCRDWKLLAEFPANGGKPYPSCKACKRAYDQARYKSDPEYRQRTIDRAMQWQTDNFDRAQAKWRKWRIDNRERKNSNERIRRLRNPEHESARAVAQAAKRRARRQSNGVYYISPREIRALRSRPCFACSATDEIEADHVVPIARGGQHSIGNLMPLCRHCNVSKGSLTWVEWKNSDRPRAVAVFRSGLEVV